MTLPAAGLRQGAAGAGTIWLSGQSGAGKSTLAQGLCRSFDAAGVGHFTLLDGEEVRQRLPRSFGHSLEDRAEVLRATIALAQEANRAGRISIVATISHQVWMRELARRSLHPFLEVILECPTAACAARDFKDHYARAFAGEYDCFVGVTHPYELPDTQDGTRLRVDTERLSAAEVLDRVWPACAALAAFAAGAGQA